MTPMNTDLNMWFRIACYTIMVSAHFITSCKGMSVVNGWYGEEKLASRYMRWACCPRGEANETNGRISSTLIQLY